jgi:hypothetical protein
MDDNISSKDLQVPQLAKDEGNNGFVSASSSATTIVEKVDDLQITSRGSSPASRKRRATSEPGPTPVIKKNRDYLPKESKPIFFELKKFYKKKSQWSAHMAFLENCAQTGNPPKSLQWSIKPPWALQNTDLMTNWIKIQTKAPADLCDILAIDCGHKARKCQETISSLSQDLAQKIPHLGYQEIIADLNHGYKLAFDRQFAEKILARTKARTRSRNPDKAKAKKNNYQANTKAKNPPNKGGPTQHKKNKPFNKKGQQAGPSKGQMNNPAHKKQDLMRQLKELTKAVGKLKS